MDETIYVSEVYETNDYRQFNEYLDAGWILLDICLRRIDGDNDQPAQLVYTLGKPGR